MLRRFCAVGLIVGVKPITKGLRRMIKNHRKVRGPLPGDRITHQLPKHVTKAGDGPNGQPVRLAGQWRQSVKSAENIARSIDKKDMVAAFDLFLCHNTIRFTTLIPRQSGGSKILPLRHHFRGTENQKFIDTTQHSVKNQRAADGLPRSFPPPLFGPPL